ncbi:hypothetical protein D1AOALGA4SA_593 [Olavius algarvensis Delta 1 endosymbiont]|nr:hypothetical protein D1AOALGA4SA_593 [Olavius algarvensis Delta 1 endosymbiont]
MGLYLSYGVLVAGGSAGCGMVVTSVAIGLIGIAGSCDKFFFGWFSDRLGSAKYAASTGFAIMAIGHVDSTEQSDHGLFYVPIGSNFSGSSTGRMQGDL